MKKIFIILFLFCALNSSFGQQSDSTWNVYQKQLDKQYNAYIQQLDIEYISHLSKLNEEYANYMRKSWEEYTAITGISLPKEKMPPIILEKEDRRNQIIDKIPIEIVPIPTPQPQPQPIAPIKENDVPSNMTEVLFYNTPIMVRKPVNISFSISQLNNNSLADAWKQLSNGDYNNLVYDCISTRDNYALSDWAYLTFLQILSEQLFGKSNEAVFLQAYIYAQSGYSMRLAYGKNHLYLLFESLYYIYEQTYFDINNKTFYPLNCKEENLFICDAKFNGEQALTLQISQEQKLQYNTSGQKEHTSRYGMTLKCSINENTLNFYNTYPVGQIGDDFGTCWATYANVPIDKNIRESLYPQIQQQIEGLSEEESANKILDWIQTGFEYQYDDSIWGYDRAFFPAETLYYPYCDCEDRSILFSRIIRDVLGLNVVLLYFPGHLATAVNFKSNVEGDYLIVNGEKYIICDPTCSICEQPHIGAPVGMSCVNDETAKVIILNN